MRSGLLKSIDMSNQLGESVKEVEAQSIELEELTPASHPGPSIGRRLDVVRDVPVKASAVLGSAGLTVEKLFALKTGDVLELDQAVNAPVALRVEGQVVAHGQIVVVGDQFGVLITEISDS